MNTISDDERALPATIESLYGELKRLARQLRSRNDGQTLTTTVLVHEVWLKLGNRLADANDRAHFLRLAARAMRQIIVDNARAHASDKRAGLHVELIEAEMLPAATPAQTIELDHAIGELEREDAALAQIAELYLFAGLNFGEIATLTERSERSVYRDWRDARMYLGRSLFGSDPPPP